MEINFTFMKSKNLSIRSFMLEFFLLPIFLLICYCFTFSAHALSSLFLLIPVERFCQNFFMDQFFMLKHLANFCCRPFFLHNLRTRRSKSTAVKITPLYGLIKLMIIRNKLMDPISVVKLTK